MSGELQHASCVVPVAPKVVAVACPLRYARATGDVRGARDDRRANMVTVDNFMTGW